MKTEATFSVSEFTGLLKETLETVFSTVSVQGEISGLKASAQGHVYFTLKDEKACISCVLWRSKLMFLPFKPKDGDIVVVHGQLSVYEARGTYQIVCNTLEAVGIGNILQELQQRKNKYQAEGLFDQDKKRPIPSRPSRVGIITSPTGAALRDILNVLQRRSSGIDLIILPAVVQGAEAAEQIARRIRQANEFAVADVLIVGRGGGSIEDLLPFSEDCVVRAVAGSQIPVISAVGHEIDWALCDYAADLRAPTPSAAAELVSAQSSEQIKKIQQLKSTMRMLITSRIRDVRLLVSSFSLERVRHSLSNRLASLRLRSDEVTSVLKKTMDSKLNSSRESLEHLRTDNTHMVKTRLVFERGRMEKDIERLKALSPVSVLDRGYSIVVGSDSKAIRSTSQLKEGTRFSVRLSDGRIAAVSEGEING